MREKFTIDELREIYGVTGRTLNNWIREKNLPVVQITPQQKWVYKEDLVNWEKSFRRNHFVNDSIHISENLL